MNRWLPLLLKTTILLLAIALVGAAAAVVWVAAVGPKNDTPRTELEKAIYLAEQTVKADPNSAGARIKLAAAYLEANKVGSAVREAETAKRLDPGNIDALYLLGLAYKKQGNLNKAASNLEKAATTDGKLADFYQQAWYELGQIQVEQKQYKKAIKSFDRALGYGPESATILYTLAQTYELTGDKEAALENYGYALEYVPTFKEAKEAIERLKKETAVKK